MSRVLQPTKTWITTAAARDWLGKDPTMCGVRVYVRQMSRSTREGASGNGVGLLWNARDIRKLLKVSQDASLSLPAAARLLAARRSRLV